MSTYLIHNGARVLHKTSYLILHTVLTGTVCTGTREYNIIRALSFHTPGKLCECELIHTVLVAV